MLEIKQKIVPFPEKRKGTFFLFDNRKEKKLPKTKIGVDFLTNRQKRRAENLPQNALILLIFRVFHSSKIPQNFFVEKMFFEANFV